MQTLSEITRDYLSSFPEGDSWFLTNSPGFRWKVRRNDFTYRG